MRWVVIEAHSHLGIAPFARNGTVWCAFRYGLSKGLFFISARIEPQVPTDPGKVRGASAFSASGVGNFTARAFAFSSMAGGLPV
jgi:hypothetical protein